MRVTRIVLGAAVVVGVVATAAFARQAALQEEQAGLLARVKVSPESARQTVLSQFPGASITESELEEEDGRLIYSFDLVVGGKKEEVEIDAITGQVLPPDAEDEDDDEESDDDDRAEGKR